MMGKINIIYKGYMDFKTGRHSSLVTLTFVT